MNLNGDLQNPLIVQPEDRNEKGLRAGLFAAGFLSCLGASGVVGGFDDLPQDDEVIAARCAFASAGIMMMISGCIPSKDTCTKVVSSLGAVILGAGSAIAGWQIYEQNSGWLPLSIGVGVSGPILGLGSILWGRRVRPIFPATDL